MANIYNNPFKDFNANFMTPDEIVKSWCNPFSNGILLNAFNEKDFRKDSMPIVLEGIRGSGKTTILKYYSYPLQIARAKQEEKRFIDVVLADESIGFYFRCDEPFVNTFKTIFSRIKKTEWTIFFEYYIEMCLCKEIINMLIELKNENPNLCRDELFIKDLFVKYNLSEFESINSINELYVFFESQIQYINSFKNNSIFTCCEFNPTFLCHLFDISNYIIFLIRKYIAEFKNINFLIMFDEFEYLPIDIQKQFNTIIKSSTGDISIRIGRRTEGNITTATNKLEEYLRLNHDYYLASLDKECSKNENHIKKYFFEIAQKRLSEYLLDDFDGKTIIDILGDKEDYDVECKEICKGNDKHIRYILYENEDLSKRIDLCNDIIKIIKNNENPIAETLNALWVARAKKDYLEVAKVVAAAMGCYFDKNDIADGISINNRLVTKYGNDYRNKYRNAITFYICSVYKKEKMYYGFNAVCYLSNGNIRTFINLCRNIFDDAMFYCDNESEILNTIPKEIQSKSIHNFSQKEFDDICSIMRFGSSIHNIILNIGNIFSFYHKDKKIRYPETNQFYFDGDGFEDFEEIISCAKSWGLIIKKKRQQRASASVNTRTDLYYINKIFSPIFNISYRTRGGYNVPVTSKMLKEMLEGVQPFIYEKKGCNSKDSDRQISFFDDEGDLNVN